jgi:hypothetical protein
VRLARLAAFATYNRDDWAALPPERAKLLIDDGEKLISELEVTRGQKISARDLRLANYMYIEAVRAIGHVELLRVITGEAADLYQDGRPTGLKHRIVSNNARDSLRRAITWMLTSEQLAPTCNLFCDLAEAYLLRKEFTEAQGYARHATLESNGSNERAYYIASECFFLEGSESSKAMAKKYAGKYKETVTLDEFKSLREELGLGQTPLFSVAA